MTDEDLRLARERKKNGCGRPWRGSRAALGLFTLWEKTRAARGLGLGEPDYLEREAGKRYLVWCMTAGVGSPPAWRASRAWPSL